MLIAISPIKMANVVAILKYKRDFHAMRPTCFKSECPAIPNTNVANKIGPTIVLTNLINPLLKGCSAKAVPGNSIPMTIPEIILVRIQVVRFFLKKA